MTDVFSPYDPLIVCLIPASLIVFYLLGAFFTPRLSSPWRNVASRAAMGALVFTFVMAVWHAGLHTMLLPFGLLLLFTFTFRPRGVLSDLADLDLNGWAITVSAVIGVTFSEMFLSDLRHGSDIVVGNWDWANSGGIGHELYITGTEGSSFLWE
jgi:hypothetical protein